MFFNFHLLYLVTVKYFLMEGAKCSQKYLILKTSFCHGFQFLQMDKNKLLQLFHALLYTYLLGLIHIQRLRLFPLVSTSINGTHLVMDAIADGQCE